MVTPARADAARPRVKETVQHLLDALADLPPDERTRQAGLATGTLVQGSITAFDTPRGQIRFVPFGKAAASRARSLLTKQPDTIAWIESFPQHSVFWDIGANIGAFSLYAALDPTQRVVAIEPSAANAYVLAANCEANGCQDRVACIAAGVGAAPSVSRLQSSQFMPGRSFTFRDREVNVFHSTQTALVLTVDQLVSVFGLPPPHFIKIDVPWLTGALIEGAAATLARPEMRELHIEMREDSKGGRVLVSRLAELGYQIKSRSFHGAHTCDVTFARA